ncbi:hypothetical protein [Paenalkalicoccus suaedae]|nr:hypothetical protein [Paenalkalicoccus suaedae]
MFFGEQAGWKNGEISPKRSSMKHRFNGYRVQTFEVKLDIVLEY